MTAQDPDALPFGQVGAQPLAPEDPRKIGAFPLRAVLGSGGMGRVYLGLAPTGYTAVKRVLPYLAADQNFLRHFSQELDNQARLPAGVSARLLAADRTARPPWFATEYIPGVTLHEAVYLEGGSLPGPSLWLLLRELADRLRVVHSLSMMHRDLKPSNVMLTHSGVTLIDFGVARAADQSAVTATGVAVGTPAFMAPEQAKAQRTLTPAVDVFSLGGVLSFAAAGLPPFGEGSGHDVFYRIVHQDPDLSALQAADPALAALVESCLAKDPADRPSAAELVSFASANTLPGPVAWPRVTAGRIAERRAFAAAAPVAEFDGTELESSWIGELGQLPTPVPPEPQPAAENANAEADVEADVDASAQAETEPIPPKNPAPLEVIPGPSPIGPRRPRRSRKTLTLLLPLLLVLGGTTGTLFAIAPWTNNSASGGNDGSKIVTTGAASASGVSDTATARSSGSPEASTKPSPSAKSSSAAPKKSTTTGTGGSTGGGSGSGGSGSGGSGGGGTTKTTAPSSGGGTKTTGPSGPGGDSGYVSGSTVTVDNCEGWLEYGSSFFKATVSAGNPAGCEESVTQTSSVTSGPTTQTFTASNGNTNSDYPCGSCFFWGAWTLSEKICVWNTAEAEDKKCSATYTYDSTTGKVT
ncbi:serine/threonine-protein kinase [Actinospica robiniae]|uniref:serine/threonine-protein kinase n=1 Tax=Actinospica robiniae TaxID=304901 RepID=UPI000429CE1F|nr:serine/threonine-protein kinase [Actinospica robiniae]